MSTGVGTGEEEPWKPNFPGWALTPAGWRDRRARPGWRVRYTTVGAAPRGLRVDQSLPVGAHALSSVLVATSVDMRSPADRDRAYWTTLARRLLQRGTLPVVRALASDAGAIEVAALAASRFVVAAEHRLEPSLELHAAYEEPFFQWALATCPRAAAFLIPQAPLESLADDEGETTTRWVDFLLAVPGREPLVLEVDGAQHERARAVDAQRDDALQQAGVGVLREPGAAVGTETSALRAAVLAAEEHLASLVTPPGDAWLVAIDTVRLVYGMVEALASGVLRSADRWLVRTNARVDPNTLGPALDALAAIDHLWDTGVMPGEVAIDGLPESRWRSSWRSQEPEGTVSEVGICVEWAPTWSALPDRGTWEVVVRGVPLAAHAGWDRDLSSDRRSIDPGRLPVDAEAAVEAIARYVYGIDRLRPGQFRAIRQILAGRDSCVLLPTGHGKTLIYHLSSLLRPGVTLVVGPLKALIDDQEQRLLAEGIDRVAAIHSGKADDSARQVLLGGVGSGNASFALVSPERLQIASFRERLQGVAARGLVALAVVDEAHCVSEWGHDFRTSYLRLGRNLRRLCRGDDDVPPPICALTGTASPAVLRDVLRELEIDPSEPGALQRPDSFDRPNLHYEVLSGTEHETVPNLRRAFVERVPAFLGEELQTVCSLRGPSTASGIIFAPWRTNEYGVTTVRRRLLDWYHEALVAGEGSEEPSIAGDVSTPKEAVGASPSIEIGMFTGSSDDRAEDAEKARTAFRFKHNEIPILVATKAFGMGVDKPNIRWTIHVGFPSSIEAFAQEAGRSGRDGNPALCLLVSGPPPREAADHLLDVTATSQERRRRFEQHTGRDDLGRQLFFLYNSFPGEEESGVNEGAKKAAEKGWVSGEVKQVAAMWDELRAAGAAPTGQVELARLTPESKKFGKREKDQIRTLRERALFRLTVIGVVDDVTIDYGAGTMKVDFAHYSQASIDEALIDFADRVQPGLHRRHLRRVDAAPSELDERIKDHAGYVVELVYETIEPARINALREMWLLTLDDPSNDRIHRTIAAYLGDGASAGVLSQIATARDLDVPGALGLLRATPPGDEFEYAASAARQLEAFPGHPILLLVRAVGEALLPQGSELEFSRVVAQAVGGFDRYEVDADDETALLHWCREALLNFRKGQRVDWLPGLWAAWQVGGGRSEVLERLEDEVLAQSDPPPPELRAILSRRADRIAHVWEEDVVAVGHGGAWTASPERQFEPEKEGGPDE